MQKKSRVESEGEGSAVEIIENHPYKQDGGEQGQYTHKIYHIERHIPRWCRSLVPKDALEVGRHIEALLLSLRHWAECRQINLGPVPISKPLALCWSALSRGLLGTSAINNYPVVSQAEQKGV